MKEIAELLTGLAKVLENQQDMQKQINDLFTRMKAESVQTKEEIKSLQRRLGTEPAVPHVVQRQDSINQQLIDQIKELEARVDNQRAGMQVLQEEIESQKPKKFALGRWGV